MSGGASEWPPLRAPMTVPIATANTAGSIPSSSKPSHHAAASPGLAFDSTLKNFHSFHSVTAKPLLPLGSSELWRRNALMNCRKYVDRCFTEPHAAIVHVQIRYLAMSYTGW